MEAMTQSKAKRVGRAPKIATSLCEGTQSAAGLIPLDFCIELYPSHVDRRRLLVWSKRQKFPAIIRFNGRESLPLVKANEFVAHVKEHYSKLPGIVASIERKVKAKLSAPK